MNIAKFLRIVSLQNTSRGCFCPILNTPLKAFEKLPYHFGNIGKSQKIFRPYFFAIPCLETKTLVCKLKKERETYQIFLYFVQCLESSFCNNSSYHPLQSDIKLLVMSLAGLCFPRMTLKAALHCLFKSANRIGFTAEFM